MIVYATRHWLTHLGYSKQHGDQPYDDDKFNGSGKFRHALRHERVADGHVPLGRERGNGKHCSVGRHFGKQTSELTKNFTKYVRISENHIQSRLLYTPANN